MTNEDEEIEEAVAKVRAALDDVDNGPMPDRIRETLKKSVETTKRNAEEAKAKPTSPDWLAPTSFGLMLLGLVIIIVFNFMGQNGPIPGLGVWNAIGGGAFAAVGLMMLTRWL